MIRRKGREIALQVLYQKDVAGLSTEEALENYKKHFNIGKKEAFEFGRELVEGVSKNIDFIDEMIQKHAPSWPINRMNITDRNILRIAVFEMFFRPDIPEVVSINEAVELAKLYGTDDSPGFINGVLDSIYKKELKDKDR